VVKVLIMKVRILRDVEIPGLGAKIKAARLKVKEETGRSLTRICADADMTTANWHSIEAEKVEALPIATLRRMEASLGVNFGVEE
jgi:hypothetical protein